MEAKTFKIKSGDREIYYSTTIGRHRFYRQLEGLQNKGMKLLTYKREQNAQRTCDRINDVYGDDFKVVVAS